VPRDRREPTRRSSAPASARPAGSRRSARSRCPSTCPRPADERDEARVEEAREGHPEGAGEHEETDVARFVEPQRPLVSRRTHTAPISASEQLLTNQPRSIGTGTPFASWMATWAGSAASRRINQDRVGARRSAASRMELGGHSVEMGYGWSFSANPIFAPRKYPAQTKRRGDNHREAVAGDPVHRRRFPVRPWQLCHGSSRDVKCVGG